MENTFMPQLGVNEFLHFRQPENWVNIGKIGYNERYFSGSLNDDFTIKSR